MIRVWRAHSRASGSEQSRHVAECAHWTRHARGGARDFVAKFAGRTRAGALCCRQTRGCSVGADWTQRAWCDAGDRAVLSDGTQGVRIPGKARVTVTDRVEVTIIVNIGSNRCICVDVIIPDMNESDRERWWTTTVGLEARHRR